MSVWCFWSILTVLAAPCLALPECSTRWYSIVKSGIPAASGEVGDAVCVCVLVCVYTAYVHCMSKGFIRLNSSLLRRSRSKHLPLSTLPCDPPHCGCLGVNIVQSQLWSTCGNINSAVCVSVCNLSLCVFLCPPINTSVASVPSTICLLILSLLRLCFRSRI